MMSNKKFIIIVPAGNNSLHESWYNSNIYDLCIIYFGDDKEIEEKYKNKSDYFIKKKGPKWQLVRYAVKKIVINKKKYEYIWLPDDDLSIKKKNVEDLFIISKKLKLKISQPSLRVPNVNIEEQINTLNHYDNIKWSSSKYIGWLKYYEKNKNFITNQITSYISYKILLQKYPTNQRMIRYSNFIEIMCPLIETNFF